MQGIYQWAVTRDDGSKLVYVGQSVKIEKRRRDYLQGWKRPESKDPNNIILRRAVLKYGLNMVDFSVLELVPSAECLTSREQYWIDLRLEELGEDNVANFMLALDSIMANPTIRAIAAEKGAQAMQDPEVIARQKEAMQKYWTEEEKERRRILMREYYSNPDNLEKSRKVGRENGHKGGYSGKGNLRKSIILRAPSGELIEMEGIALFCRTYGLSSGNLYGLLKGKWRQYKGWTLP